LQHSLEGSGTDHQFSRAKRHAPRTDGGAGRLALYTFHMARPYIGSKDWQCRQLAAESRLPRLRLELQLSRGALLVACVVCACAVLFSFVWFLTIPAAPASPLASVILLSGCIISGGLCWKGVRAWLVAEREMIMQARQALLKVYGSNTTVDELVETFHWRFKAVQQAHVDWDDGGYDPGDTDGNLASFRGGGLASLLHTRSEPGSAAPAGRQWDKWLGPAAAVWAVACVALLQHPSVLEAMSALIPIYVAFSFALLLWSLTRTYSSCARSVALVELTRDLSARELEHRREAAQDN
jgi:hypothetical protein